MKGFQIFSSNWILQELEKEKSHLQPTKFLEFIFF